MKRGRDAQGAGAAPTDRIGDDIPIAVPTSEPPLRPPVAADAENVAGPGGAVVDRAGARSDGPVVYAIAGLRIHSDVELPGAAAYRVHDQDVGVRDSESVPAPASTQDSILPLRRVPRPEPIPADTAGPARPGGSRRDPVGTPLYRGPGHLDGGLRQIAAIRGPSGIVVEVAGAGRFEISDRGEIVWLDPRAVVEASRPWQAAALGPALSIALAMRGIWCLHASAVLGERGVYVFVGRSGAGKSTTAALLAARDGGGLALVADDCLPVRTGIESAGGAGAPGRGRLRLPEPESEIEHGARGSGSARAGADRAAPIALPAFPQLALPADRQPAVALGSGLEALETRGRVGGADRPRAGQDRAEPGVTTSGSRADVGRHVHGDLSLPIAGIFEIQVTTGAGRDAGEGAGRVGPAHPSVLTIEILPPAAATASLVRHTIASRLFDGALLERHARDMAEIAERVPVGRIELPRRLDIASELADRLRDAERRG